MQVNQRFENHSQKILIFFFHIFSIDDDLAHSDCKMIFVSWNKKEKGEEMSV